MKIPFKIFLPSLLCSFFVFTSRGQNINLQWAKRAGDGGQDYSYCITVDSLGNVYSTGFYNGTVDFDPGPGIYNLTSAGANDIFVYKLDAAGAFLWAKSLGGASNDNGFAIAVDGSGNVYTTGTFLGTADFDPGIGTYDLSSSGAEDVFVSKLGPSGAFIWAKKIGGLHPMNVSSLALDLQENIYLTGNFLGTVNFDPGAGTLTLSGSTSHYSAFISKLSETGHFDWAKKFSGSSGCNSKSITLDKYCNVYTTGNFEDTVDFDPGSGIYNLEGVSDAFISKLDSTGTFIWAKNIGRTYLSYCSGQSIALDSQENMFIKGMYTGIADFDPGAIMYNLPIPSVSDGNSNVFITKLDALGNFIWARQIGGSTSVPFFGRSVTTDRTGNVYSTGFFTDTADFDPGSGNYNLIPYGASNTFISKLDASGSFVWAKQFSQSAGFSIAIAPSINEDIYISGIFNGTVDFDPESGIYDLTSSGLNDLYIAKLSNPFIGITEEDNFLFDLNIYPNPAKGNFNITFIVPEKGNYKIELISQEGKQIDTILINAFEGIYSKELNISDYAKGLYFILVNNEEKRVFRKILIHQ